MNKYCENAFNSLTDYQISYIESNLDKKLRKEISGDLNIPEIRLRRAALFKGWKFVFHRKREYSKEIINEVLKSYVENGPKKTREIYGDKVKLRSIIEKYGAGKRPWSKRWTNKQIVDLVRFSGIVSKEKQAAYFKRPNAHAGSIRSAYSKIFNCNPRSLNGLPEWKAKYILKKGCPFLKTDYKNGMKLYLWVDCEKYLRDDCHQVIKDAVKAMANFQRIFFKDARKEIDEYRRKLH